jgi:hypothetical protein
MILMSGSFSEGEAAAAASDPAAAAAAGVAEAAAAEDDAAALVRAADMPMEYCKVERTTGTAARCNTMQREAVQFEKAEIRQSMGELTVRQQ